MTKTKPRFNLWLSLSDYDQFLPCNCLISNDVSRLNIQINFQIIKASRHQININCLIDKKLNIFCKPELLLWNYWKLVGSSYKNQKSKPYLHISYHSSNAFTCWPCKWHQNMLLYLNIIDGIHLIFSTPSLSIQSY